MTGSRIIGSKAISVFARDKSLAFSKSISRVSQSVFDPVSNCNQVDPRGRCIPLENVKFAEKFPAVSSETTTLGDNAETEEEGGGEGGGRRRGRGKRGIAFHSLHARASARKLRLHAINARETRRMLDANGRPEGLVAAALKAPLCSYAYVPKFLRCCCRSRVLSPNTPGRIPYPPVDSERGTLRTG